MEYLGCIVLKSESVFGVFNFAMSIRYLETTRSEEENFIKGYLNLMKLKV